MKSNHYAVKQGTKRLPHFQLVSKANNIVRLMTDNPHFPDPNPRLDVVEQACEELDIMTRAYDFNRGRFDMQARDAAYARLRRLLVFLGSYVQCMAQGDATIIHSAGFETKTKVQPSQPLAAPERVVAKRTLYPGTLVVRWGAVKNRKTYRVQVNVGDPRDVAGWKDLTYTGRNQVLAEGLESDRTYYFRIMAVGALGESPVSDVAMAKAA